MRWRRAPIETAVLVLPPVFGAEPWMEVSLGLACLNGVLRGAGVQTQWALVARAMAQREPALHDALDAATTSERGGLFAVDPALVLDCIAPGSFPRHGALGTRVRAFVEAYLDEVLDEPPDVALVYTSTPTAGASAACGHALRERGSFVVMGGPGVRPARVRHLFLRAGACDLVVEGDGEPAVAALLEASRHRGDLASVPAATFLDAGGDAVSTPPARRARLADLPPPDLTGLELVETVPIAAARGCTRDCAFCSERAIWGGFRLRPAADVAREMLSLAEQYPELPLFFRDDLVNANPRWVDRLCAAVDAATEDPPLWRAFVEPEGLDEARAERMAIVGFRDALLGVQHFSERMLARMGRRPDVAHIESVLEALDRAGINIHFDIIVGFPGETEADHIENVERLRVVHERYGWAQAMVHPFCVMEGAAVETFPDAYGVRLVPWQAEDVPHPWRDLVPVVTAFPRDVEMDPPPAVVARRRRELEAAIESVVEATRGFRGSLRM